MEIGGKVGSRKAGIAAELLLMLVVVVATAAGVLLLVKFGIVEVRQQQGELQVLDAEFLPVREGSVVIRDFQLCRFVDAAKSNSWNEQCVGEGEEFYVGEEIHFRFLVDSSTSFGEVRIKQNYQIRSLEGRVILEVDDAYAKTAEQGSRLESPAGEMSGGETAIAGEMVTIGFQDYFFADSATLPGRYVLEVFVHNPLLQKQATVRKEFVVLEEISEGFEEI